MCTVFISYRREDSLDIRGRIKDHLVRSFGEEHVFRDVDSIPGGVRFPEKLADELAACEVMLVIVGRQWLRINDEAGRRRLDLRPDWVRREIETAFKRGITVVPVLVQNASMPSKSHLPPCLRDLTDCNAVRVNSDAAFADDMNRLIAALPASLVPAAEDLLDALELSEDEEAELQSLFTAGVALMDDHQYTAAIRIFERAVQLDPYDGEFWLRLGEAHWGAKRLDEAVAAFARCTTLEPDNSLAWSFSAYVCGEQSRFEAALAAWDHVLQIDPSEWDALLSRVSALRSLGRMEEADEAEEKAQEVRRQRREEGG